MCSHRVDFQYCQSCRIMLAPGLIAMLFVSFDKNTNAIQLKYLLRSIQFRSLLPVSPRLFLTSVGFSILVDCWPKIPCFLDIGASSGTSINRKASRCKDSGTHSTFRFDVFNLPTYRPLKQYPRLHMLFISDLLTLNNVCKTCMYFFPKLDLMWMVDEFRRMG